MTSNRSIGWRRTGRGVAGLLAGLVSSAALACADGIFFDRFVDDQRPGLAGLDLNGDGQAETVNQGGCLLPDLEWVKDFPLTVAIDGDADEYSSSLGTVSGNEWTFEADTSGLYTLTAHRDGLEDSGDGQLDLRVARVTDLGDSPVQDSVSEWRVEKELPCGEEYSGAFATNIDDLVPGITASYEAATTMPIGSSLTPEGVFTFTPSCSAGSPVNVIFAVDSEIESQGNSLGLEQVVVDIDISGVDPGGPGPTVDGLIGADGTIDYFVQDDNGTLFISPIEYLCGRTRHLEIVGDAESYELVDSPEDMSIQLIDDKPTIVHEPEWELDGCADSPNGNESEFILRAHKNNQTLDIEKTAWAMDPRIDCVTHYPGIPAGGGSPPEPVEYCDDSDDGAIDEIIYLSYNIETMHEIHVHVRPSLDNYTPHRTYEFEGSDIDSNFMSLNVNAGVISVNPISDDEGLYFPSVRAFNGGKIADWKGIDFRVIE